MRPNVAASSSFHEVNVEKSGKVNDFRKD